jgi:hypothetical protein
MGQESPTSPIRSIRFDKAGQCVSPEARSAIIDEAARGDRPVLVLAHGWNNTWPQALARFTSWYDGVFEEELAEKMRPLVIGIFWPSTWLTFRGERGPALAASPAEAAAELEELQAAIDLLPPGIQPELRDALATGPLSAAAARHLAKAAASQLPPDDLSGEALDDSDAETVLERWAAVTDPGLAPVRQHFGTAGSASAEQEHVAALSLDPRDLIRLVSVWTMHDRARNVGRSGVSALLRDLLAVTRAPVHLVGHSYGCQVHLAAVTAMRSSRPVESALLLQPAVNYLCLSARLPNGRPSAYRDVLSRVRQPLLITYSKHDFPLTRLFHRALRRHGDVGEVAAWPAPPSPYAALGGFGPGELGDECEWGKLPVPAWSRAPAAGRRVRALDGSAHISGHGDVTNSACCGLLRSQLLGASEDE